jgi:deazaflavin-dependent oxidoreductase (nitroreductase family)
VVLVLVVWTILGLILTFVLAVVCTADHQQPLRLIARVRRVAFRRIRQRISCGIMQRILELAGPASSGLWDNLPMSQRAPQRLKRGASRSVERRLVNPLVRRLVFAGKCGSTYAVLETKGRRTGLSRRTPVANGLREDTFWLISAHGPYAHYFQNLLADPKVRVGLARNGQLLWRSGTAQPVWDDDARHRHRQLAKGRLGYWLDGWLLRSTATKMTTVRIDLEPERSRSSHDHD